MGTLISLGIILSSIPLIEKAVNAPVASTPPSWDWNTSCKIMQANDENRDKSCFFGEQKSQIDVILFGDSHAAAASKTIVQAARMNDLNIEVFSLGGCRFLLRKFMASKKETNFAGESCLDHNSNLQEIIKQKKPKIIVYVHKGPDSRSSRSIERQFAVRSLRQLMIGSDIQTLVVVGTVPMYKYSNTILTSWISRQPKIINDPFEDDIFWTSQLDEPDEIFLPLTKQLCVGSCSPMINQKWVYEDEHHLNQFGYGLFLADFLRVLK
jgi:hypothetical protein